MRPHGTFAARLQQPHEWLIVAAPNQVPNVDEITITFTIPAFIVRLVAVALPAGMLGGLMYALGGAVPAMLAATTALGSIAALYQWLFTHRPPR